MAPELQRCRCCGYQRHKAPSAYGLCCGQPLETVRDEDIWQGRPASPRAVASETGSVISFGERIRARAA